MLVQSKLGWFLLGAAVAAAATTLILRSPYTPDRAPAPEPDASHETLARQLTRIEQRLDASRAPAAMQAPMARTNTVSATESNSAAAANTDAAAVAARQAGGQIIDQAIQAGVWTRKDAAAFAAASSGMKGEDRFELQRKLNMAVNEDRLKPEAGGLFH